MENSFENSITIRNILRESRLMATEIKNDE
ncbi:hypothetical protein EYM_06630 [Ignicoccus islandicus DSM 13165]|uniref:Uncharacterized protein n=1 Tax=Ignicoccus islandicus DSM 13165 TaxID=940295 RepID=A0A0U3FTB6_9CREN|nr:hypothetical protein EYM_06630 [Ignicoccus islandicus DSM 13165]